MRRRAGTAAVPRQATQTVVKGSKPAAFSAAGQSWRRSIGTGRTSAVGVASSSVSVAALNDSTSGRSIS